MESYQYECSEKYAEMQTFYTYVLLKHCHMENLSICMYMCIHHSEITTAVRKKKKARNIKWQCLDMDLSLMFQLFYHDQKY